MKKYDKNEHDQLAFELSSQGLSIKDISIRMNISVNTFYIWLRKKPSFRESYRKGESLYEKEMLENLYKKMRDISLEGYEVISKKTEKNSTGEVVKVIEQKRNYPTDVKIINKLLKKYEKKIKAENENKASINEVDLKNIFEEK